MAVLVVCMLISKVRVMVNVKRNQIQSPNNEKLLKLGRNLNFLNTPSNKQGQCLPEELQKPHHSPTKSENDRITAVVGDSIIKNLQGRKLAKAVGHR